MQFFADLENDATGIWWAVCSLDNKTFYGAGWLHSLSRVHKKAEIGLWAFDRVLGTKNKDRSNADNLQLWF